MTKIKAGAAQRTYEVGLETVGYQTLTVDGTVRALTVPNNAFAAFITAEAGPVRFRFDGLDPSATEGHILNDGDCLMLKGQNKVRAFRAVRTQTVSGVLKATFLG